MIMLDFYMIVVWISGFQRRDFIHAAPGMFYCAKRNEFRLYKPHYTSPFKKATAYAA